MIPMPPLSPVPERNRNRQRFVRVLTAIIVGVVMGQLCPQLPINWQALCHLAAKVVAFVFGGA